MDVYLEYKQHGINVIKRPVNIQDHHMGVFPTPNESITFMSTNGVSLDEVRIFGSRGKRYTLEEWIRKHEDLDENV